MLAKLAWIMFTTVVLSGMTVVDARAEWEHAYSAPGHHEYHEWYQSVQKSLGVAGCCDEDSKDCGPVAKYIDPGVEKDIRVLLEDGEWYVAFGAKKFYVDTPDGRAHVCRKPSYPSVTNFGKSASGFNFYCVFVPRPTM